MSTSDDFLLDEPEPTKKEKGLDELMNRFVKHAKATHKRPSNIRQKTVTKEVNLTIVRKEIDKDGNEQLKTEELAYTSTEVDLKQVEVARKSDKPGAQHLALRQTLKEKIMAKKREERKRKEEMKNAENEEGLGCVEDEEEELLDDDFDDEENDSDGEEMEEDADDEEEEDEEDTEQIMRDMDAKGDKKRRKIKSAFVDEEAEEEDEDDMGNLALEEDSEEENLPDTLELPQDENLPDTLELLPQEEEENTRTSLIASSKQSSNQLKPGVTAGQTRSSVDLLTPFSQMEEADNMPRFTPFDERTSSLDVPSKTQSNEAQNAKKRLGFEGLFDSTDAQTDDMDDVIGLCSGQFVTQKTQSVPPPDQTPDTVVNTQNLTQSQLETQDTVILDQSEVEKTQRETPGVEVEDTRPGSAAVGGFVDSDDDDEGSTVTKQKKRKRLVMSDDSDDADDNNPTNAQGSEEEDEKGDYEDEEDAMDEAVEYDSDENIVERPKEPEFKGFKSKKGGLRREFLEREAELSGSDADSGDEDEKGLDRMELEEGDLDDLDEDEVREQVEKIHQKQILDQDQREIKLFQEAFLEDGELHSDQVRARKFKWMGVGKQGFKFCQWIWVI